MAASGVPNRQQTSQAQVFGNLCFPEERDAGEDRPHIRRFVAGMVGQAFRLRLQRAARFPADGPESGQSGVSGNEQPVKVS